MRRTKLVLVAAALMVAMLVAFSAPTMANSTNDNNVQRNSSNIFHDNHHNDIFDDGDCCRDHDGDFEFVLDDDNDFSFNTFGFNTFDDSGCREWSWVFEEWEWDCD
jgi:hypothetical protein